MGVRIGYHMAGRCLLALAVLGSSRLAAGGEEAVAQPDAGSSADTATVSPASFARLRLREADVIVRNSFPPFVVRRMYDSEGVFKGILGPGWWCWPFDRMVREGKVFKTNVLYVKDSSGASQQFVQIEGNEYVSMDAAKISTVRLEKTPEGCVLKDLRRGKQVYDRDGRLLQLCNTRGGTMTVTWDGAGMPASVALNRPRKAIYGITCDSKTARLTQIRGPDGQKWRYEYDRAGRFAKLVRADGSSATYTYQAGRLVERSAESGRWVKYRYDQHGRLVETNRNGRKEIREYKQLSPPGDWVLKVTDPVGRVTERQFLASKRTEMIREKDGNVIVKTYDENNRLQYVSSTKGGAYRYERDEKGRPVAILDHRGRLTQIRYDNVLGLPSTVINPRGQVQKMRYNAHGQLASTSMPDGRKVSMKYNRLGQPLQVTDSERGTTRLRYGSAGKLAALEHDSLGRVDAEKLKPRTSLAAFLLRPAVRSVPMSEARLEVIRLLDQASPIGSSRPPAKVKTKEDKELKCTYDQFRNLVSLEREAQAIAKFNYDAVDRLTEISYGPAAKELFEYDTGDRVSRHVAPDRKEYRYKYDVRGMLLWYKLPSGEESSYVYDKEGRLARARNAHWHDAFGYDREDRLTKVGWAPPDTEKPKRLVTYTYDRAGRLEATLFENGLRCTRKYEDNGSTERLSVSGVEIVLHYDKDHRCTAVDFPYGRKAEFGYRDDGSLTRVALREADGMSAMSQYCQYKDARLSKAILRIGDKTKVYSLKYSAEGRILNTDWLAKPGDAAEEHDPRVYDALGYRRLAGAEKTRTEYAYGLMGVFRARRKEREQCFVRSSDAAVRIVIEGDRKAFLVPSGLPAQAFLLPEKGSRAHPVEWRDTNSAHAWAEWNSWDSDQ